MASSRPLDTHQQHLVNIVKIAHSNLAVARKVRNAEVSRRIALEEEKIRIEAARQRDEVAERVRLELDYEITQHEVALDDALIEAYNAGIPVRRISIDGFGNRYPGTVQQLLVKLRDAGLIGNSVNYQRSEEREEPIQVEFPRPVDVSGLLSEATTISGPEFEPLRGIHGHLLELVEPDKDGENGIYVPAVILSTDSRDPYFKTISANARPGTPYKHATTVTLYLHPATGELRTHESDEVGDILWDHPVARWVKDHPEEARAGFDAVAGS